MTEELIEVLKGGLGTFGLELTAKKTEQFELYIKMLKDWNTRINLTAIKEDREIVIKHFIDSATILPFIFRKSAPDARLIDIGTGAGFPGVVLKIMCPGLKVTLLDSLQKRINFLTALTEELGLKEIICLHARAEDAARLKEHRESYDLAVARAVASMPVLLEYSLPFVKTGGFFIAMKGSNSEKIDTFSVAMSELSGKMDEEENLLLPETNIQRHVLYIKKVRQVSTKYPRKAGKVNGIVLKQ
ncbi:MAG: 16S rRNA (guanine(527)-N(7))-methyltransferase RsmG [Clostridiales bacterium]|jgi:16S rRNA (guanine527-N7)-methyltransferase|nr:16S rRNA (guanine(527)-N(7))-methyltransferase RsmG [Clostridiales bacterium]